MAVKEKVARLLQDALASCVSDGLLPPGEYAVALDAPKQAAHGDYSCNAAMVFARQHMQAAGLALSAAEQAIATGSRALADGALDGISAPTASWDAVGENSLALTYASPSFPSPWSSGAVGCFRATGQGVALVAPDGATCTADDHLEIDFANGDVVHFAGDAVSASTQVWMTAGAFSGTSLVVTAKGPLQARIAGHFAYQAADAHLDVDVDWTDTRSGPAADSSQQFLLSATDHLANVSIDAQWSFASIGSLDSTTTVAGREVFAVAGAAASHSVEFDSSS